MTNVKSYIEALKLVPGTYILRCEPSQVHPNHIHGLVNLLAKDKIFIYALFAREGALEFLDPKEPLKTVKL